MVLAMSGFSFMLYSRLNILIHDKRLLRIILYCIIATSVVLQPAIVYGTVRSQTTPGSNIVHITAWFGVAFVVQDVILAALYIYYFQKYMKHDQNKWYVRSTLASLILAEVVVVLTDAPGLVFLFMEW